MSTSREFDDLAVEASPKQIAKAAKQTGSQSVAFTYNDPVIFAEYAIDTANACRDAGIHPIAVSAGYICDEPGRALYGAMDAANIDLKGFTDRFYRKVTGGRLETVLETLKHVNDSDCWLEITTLLIPGENDDAGELREMSQWIVENLGPNVPHHFSAFHPAHRMLDTPPTPPETLQLARDIAMEEGEHYVYTGNTFDPNGQSTYCPTCGERVIFRDRYFVRANHLVIDEDGRGSCPACNTHIPGVFA